MQASRRFPWGEAERRGLVRLCASLSGDPAAAEDLAQETLLEAWRHADRLHDPAGADRWLAAVARNVCLRRGRQAGREVAVQAAARRAAPTVAEVDLDEELARADLAGLVSRALALLPADARDVLTRRYVDGVTPAEIGAALGIGQAAASMRLARGKAALRRLLATELRDDAAELGLAPLAEDGWSATRVWCGRCGGRRLLARSERPRAVSFRCPGCEPRASRPGSEYRLDNPLFARLLGDVVRPSAILARAAEWSHRYFAGGAGSAADCTRCARPVAIRRYRRESARAGGLQRDGLHAACAACGEAVSSSLAGLALTLPEVRALRREHPRTVARAAGEVDFAGTPALVAEVTGVHGARTVAAIYARDTLRLLAVR